MAQEHRGGERFKATEASSVESCTPRSVKNYGTPRNSGRHHGTGGDSVAQEGREMDSEAT